MASNAFAEIGKRGNCRAICMDIEDFFGSINHQILLFNLKMILGVERLTPDWFAVYKSMTKFSWIDIEALCNELNIDAKNQPRPLCATETYRTIVRKEARLVNKNQNAWGIPQGSPMSAVLSNVYMVTFDNNMFEYMSNINGSYRRYSDDILLISDIGADSGVADVVDNELTKLGRSIKINHEKTERSEFSIVDDMQHVDRPVTYLGFTFDGEKSKIRDRTISRFYRRMTYAARQAANTAKRNDSPLVFKRKLFRHFSHLGKANLYSYARRAAAAMDDMTPKLQLKRHFKILLRKIKTRGR